MRQSPLRSAIFVYEHLPLDARTAAGVTFEVEEIGTGATLADLVLELHESSRGIEGYLCYRSDLWRRATAEGLAARFLALLERAVADSGRRISHLLA